MSGFNMYASWSTIALLHGSQVVGCVVASWMLETRGRKQSLACFATLTSVVSVLLSYAPWYEFVVIVGTCSVSALLAGTWSCVLVYTPENYPTAVRARGVSYAFGFSRLGAAGGVLLYPHMFDVWLMSVSAITWVFAGLLAATVLGIVVPYGFDPSRNGYNNEYRATETDDSDIDLESGGSHENENGEEEEEEEEQEDFFLTGECENTDKGLELKSLASHEPEQEVSPRSGHRD